MTETITKAQFETIMTERFNELMTSANNVAGLNQGQLFTLVRDFVKNSDDNAEVIGDIIRSTVKEGLKESLMIGTKSDRVSAASLGVDTNLTGEARLDALSNAITNNIIKTIKSDVDNKSYTIIATVNETVRIDENLFEAMQEASKQKEFITKYLANKDNELDLNTVQKLSKDLFGENNKVTESQFNALAITTPPIVPVILTTDNTPNKTVNKLNENNSNSTTKIASTVSTNPGTSNNASTANLSTSNTVNTPRAETFDEAISSYISKLPLESGLDSTPLKTPENLKAYASASDVPLNDAQASTYAKAAIQAQLAPLRPREVRQFVETYYEKNQAGATTILKEAFSKEGTDDSKDKTPPILKKLDPEQKTSAKEWGKDQRDVDYMLAAQAIALAEYGTPQTPISVGEINNQIAHVTGDRAPLPINTDYVRHLINDKNVIIGSPDANNIDVQNAYSALQATTFKDPTENISGTPRPEWADVPLNNAQFQMLSRNMLKDLYEKYPDEMNAYIAKEIGGVSTLLTDDPGKFMMAKADNLAAKIFAGMKEQNADFVMTPANLQAAFVVGVQKELLPAATEMWKEESKKLVDAKVTAINKGNLTRDELKAAIAEAEKITYLSPEKQIERAEGILDVAKITHSDLEKAQFGQDPATIEKTFAEEKKRDQAEITKNGLNIIIDKMEDGFLKTILSLILSMIPQSMLEKLPIGKFISGGDTAQETVNKSRLANEFKAEVTLDNDEIYKVQANAKSNIDEAEKTIKDAKGITHREDKFLDKIQSEIIANELSLSNSDILKGFKKIVGGLEGRGNQISVGDLKEANIKEIVKGLIDVTKGTDGSNSIVINENYDKDTGKGKYTANP